MLLEFGARPGGIAQVAYVVPDIDAAMREYTRHLGVGPWFVRGPFTPPEGLLRGRPHSPSLTLARGFTGHTMIELITQHDEGPSVYHEDPGQPRRYGFHHWAVMTPDFDAAVARYAHAGCDEAFSDRLPSGSRVVYVDAVAILGGMIEVIEHTPAQERTYTEMYQAAVGWTPAQALEREEIVRAHR
jgi:catechol 2,3-dioxygenase-like lactoylglutathione lyase family enzyme